MTVFGIKLIGLNAETVHKLLLTVIVIAVLIGVRYLLRWIIWISVGSSNKSRVLFWMRQGISLLVAIVMVVMLLSIWFDKPERLATAIGLISAGLAFAMQKPVTSVVAYFTILRGNSFSVGDRIQMGGVRGDVIALGFMQTIIMEMGQPPAVQNADPAMWVQSRQFTGRIVSVANSVIFDEPVFNYTRDFPFIWEETHIPIPYTADHARAEQILLEVSKRLTANTMEPGQQSMDHLRQHYHVQATDFQPKVYYRLTDNWIELTVRFLTPAHRIRELKDQMAREVLAGLNAAKIGIASGTYEIVGFPPIRIERVRK